MNASSRRETDSTDARRAPQDDAGTAGDLETQSIGYLARYAHRAFVKTLAFELEAYEMFTSHWSVLRVLWQQEGLTQVELAEKMRVEKASLTGVLGSMETLGVIERRRNSEDKRKVNTYLTKKGRSLKSSLLPLAPKINRRATKGMTTDEVVMLQKLLSRVIVNLEL